MSLRENVTQSVTLFAAILPAFVLGFGGMWIGMQSIASDIRTDLNQFRTEVRAEIGQMRTDMRTELSQVRTEMRTELGHMRGQISNLAQRVARIEGRLGIPAPPPDDHAATDPATPPPASDTPERSTIDG